MVYGCERIEGALKQIIIRKARIKKIWVFWLIVLTEGEVRIPMASLRWRRLRAAALSGCSASTLVGRWMIWAPELCRLKGHAMLRQPSTGARVRGASQPTPARALSHCWRRRRLLRWRRRAPRRMQEAAPAPLISPSQPRAPKSSEVVFFPSWNYYFGVYFWAQIARKTNVCFLNLNNSFQIWI